MKLSKPYVRIGIASLTGIAAIAGITIASRAQSPDSNGPKGVATAVPQSFYNNNSYPSPTVVSGSTPPSQPLTDYPRPTATPAYPGQTHLGQGLPGQQVNQPPVITPSSPSNYYLPNPMQMVPAPIGPDKGYVKWSDEEFKAVHLGRTIQGEEAVEAMKAHQEAAKFAKDLKNEEPDSDKSNNARKKLQQYLNALFDIDLQEKQSQVEELENRLNKLKQQISKRENSKDRIVELKLTLLENDRSGLAFPSNFNQSALIPGSYGASYAPQSPDAWSTVLLNYKSNPYYPPYGTNRVNPGNSTYIPPMATTGGPGPTSTVQTSPPNRNGAAATSTRYEKDIPKNTPAAIAAPPSNPAGGQQSNRNNQPSSNRDISPYVPNLRSTVETISLPSVSTDSLPKSDQTSTSSSPTKNEDSEHGNSEPSQAIAPE